MVKVRLNGVEQDYIPSGVITNGTQFSDDKKSEMVDFLRNFKPATVSQIQGTSDVSAARARLEKLRAMRGPEIVPFEYEGEQFYCRKLTLKQIIRLSVNVQRDCQGALQSHRAISAEDAGMISLYTTLEACLCNEDGTPYFSRELIEEYAEEPGATSLLSNLALHCYDTNPDILNTLKKS